MLANSHQGALLVIAYTGGQPRIRIGVDADDRSRIEMLDADGKVVGRLRQEWARPGLSAPAGAWPPSSPRVRESARGARPPRVRR